MKEIHSRPQNFDVAMKVNPYSTSGHYSNPQALAVDQVGSYILVAVVGSLLLPVRSYFVARFIGDVIRPDMGTWLVFFVLWTVFTWPMAVVANLMLTVVLTRIPLRILTAIVTVSLVVAVSGAFVLIGWVWTIPGLDFLTLTAISSVSNVIVPPLAALQVATIYRCLTATCKNESCAAAER